MQQQLTKLRGTWGGLPTRAQYAIIGVAAITVLVMFLVLRAATTTEWTAATPPLPAEKLGAAETALDEAGIKHQISSSGDVVEVPVADHPKAANALIPAGIAVKGGRSTCADVSQEGSSLIAQTSAQHDLMTETCSENQVANALEQLDGVEKATVDATLPAKSLFASEEEPAKAAVLIDTDGAGLPKGVVKGMQQSVAGAFPGLKPGAVTIQDETGAVLGGSGSEDEASASMAKLDAESKLNAKIENDLGAKIESIVGKDNIVLTSNVELDMDKIQREVVDVEAAGDDGEQLVDNENYNNELLNGSATDGVQGVAGTGTNTGVDPADRRTVTDDADTSTNPDSNYVKEVAGIQYANNKVAEAIQVAPGMVQRFRIGAVVDDDVDPAAANAVKNVLLAWMGGNAEDSLSFDQAPIATASTAVTKGSSGTATAIAGYVKWVLLGLGLIGLAFVLRRTLTQRTAELLSPADDLLLLESGDFTPIPIAELEAALAANQPDADRRARIEMQKKVELLAEHKPNDVANELRRWMTHDEPGHFSPAMSRKGMGA